MRRRWSCRRCWRRWTRARRRPRPPRCLLRCSRSLRTSRALAAQHTYTGCVHASDCACVLAWVYAHARACLRVCSWICLLVGACACTAWASAAVASATACTVQVHVCAQEGMLKHAASQGAHVCMPRIARAGMHLQKQTGSVWVDTELWKMRVLAFLNRV